MRRCDACGRFGGMCGCPEAPARPVGLTVEQLGFLKLAGSWGMLRQQSRRRFMLAGEFSLPLGDMVKLIEAAGGIVDPGGSIPAGTVDVLVLGEDVGADLVRVAIDCVQETWDEAELVLELLPSLASLQAAPGEAPF